MTFVESIQTCFRKYAEFNGRATRPEFWWWVLFVLLASIAGNMLGDAVGGLVSLAVLMPYLAVAARRLHDTGRSGWWQIVWVIPVIGWALMIYWCVQESTGPNQYG